MVRGANEIPIGAKAMRRRPGRLSTTSNTCVFIRLQLELFSPVLERGIYFISMLRVLSKYAPRFLIYCVSCITLSPNEMIKSV